MTGFGNARLDAREPDLRWTTCPSRLPQGQARLRAVSGVSSAPPGSLVRGLRRVRAALGGRRVAALPVPGGGKHRIRVRRLAAAAVVAAQRHEQVAALAVDVVAQDHAAEAQVGLHVEQLAGIAVADHARPERHHLHVAARAHRTHGELAEIAFHLDQAQHQAGVQAGAPALVPDRLQEFLALLPFGLALAPAAGSWRPASAGRPAARRMSRNSGIGGAALAMAELSAVRTESASGSSIWPPACAGSPGATRGPAPPGRPCRQSRRLITPASRPLRKPSTSPAAHLGRRGIAPVLVFQLAFLEAAVGDHHAMRHADQFPVGEHGARAARRGRRA